MKDFVIVGSGFSALISYYFLKKFNIQTISSNNTNYNLNNLKSRKNLNTNKFFSTKSESKGNFTYYKNRSFKIHDRLSFGGNTNLWGGFIDIQELPKKTLGYFQEDQIRFEKLNLNTNGYKSNLDTLRQLRDSKNRILNSSKFINDILPGYVDSIKISPSTSTTYTLFGVTDAFCSNTANGTVIVTVNPLSSATISGGAILCADGSTAQIDITANGTPPFNVVYSDGFNNVALNGINTPYNFQSNTAGTYTLNSITDANGCIDTGEVVINSPPPLVLTSDSVPSTCSGICDGIAIVDASGGTAPYNFIGLKMMVLITIL